MADTPRWRRLVEPVLSVGAYEGEPETKRARRRVLAAAIVIATLLTIPSAFVDLGGGYTWVAAVNLVVVAATPVFLVAIRLRPHPFAQLVTALFVLVVFVNLLVETTLFGGLLPSGLVPMFGLGVVLGAMVGIGLQAAVWWFVVFVASVVYAIVIAGRMDPMYTMPDPSEDAAFNLIATGVLVFAVLVYFVHQRDRFQRRSDDLLHNILPDEIVGRLKAGGARIADDVGSASVLFADVVGLTPMSATMSPAELVGLLEDVFTRFDGFVAELGLEEIKTEGDAYMVAAGAPRSRSAHAHAIADLALRIRDDVVANPIECGGDRRTSEMLPAIEGAATARDRIGSGASRVGTRRVHVHPEPIDRVGIHRSPRTRRQRSSFRRGTGVGVTPRSVRSLDMRRPISRPPSTR